MANPAKKKPYKKIALVLSLCAILLWTVLGTGASLAWFTDTSEKVTNIFHFAEFDLEVSYRQEDGTYAPLDGQTKLFNDQALYEPGYTQVVYLKVENRGTVPFDFKTAVSVTDYTVATNVFGQHFQLQDYLTFGFVTAPTEAGMDAQVARRSQAAAIATHKLNNYATDAAALGAGETVYMALVVRMPERVGNEANYRGDTVPKVELGIIVTATQQTN